ncbi:MAG: hypothetical protein WCA78_07085 [Rhizomicrobium sp.]|jgi:hypothetical protein
MKRTSLAILGAVLLAAAAAQAQTTRYNVKTMDFDLWCTEEQHLPYERCDKRLPEDMQKFEAYRAVVEKYEIPYLQKKEQKLQFDRDILHNDPIDNPPQPDTPKPNATDGKSP